MIEINFDKLYRYPRIAEPCTICIPVEKGKIYSKDNVCVMQDGKPVPTQAKVTSRYDDTSIRYLFVRFMADLPANKGTKVYCELDCKDVNDNPDILCTESSTGIEVDTGALRLKIMPHTFLRKLMMGIRYIQMKILPAHILKKLMEQVMI